MNEISNNIQTLFQSRDDIGDSPVWLPQSQELIWLDTLKQTINTLDLAGEQLSTFRLSLPIYAIGKRSDGRLWAISENTVCDVNPKTGDVTQISNEAELPEHSRLNNAGVDARGRVWAGCMDRAARPGKGNIYRFSESGEAEKVATGFGACNGIAWSPDNSELYYLDTLQRTLIAFEFDVEAGRLGAPRLVFDFLDLKGKPHGLTIDPEGDIWIAMWGSGCVLKLSSQGQLLQQIELPAKNVCACTLDDANHDLFITSALFRTNPMDTQLFPENGNLFCVTIQPNTSIK